MGKLKNGKLENGNENNKEMKAMDKSKMEVEK